MAEKDDDERVSLPLDPETALRALLAVKPDDDQKPQTGAKKPKKPKPA